MVRILTSLLIACALAAPMMSSADETITTSREELSPDKLDSLVVELNPEPASDTPAFLRTTGLWLTPRGEPGSLLAQLEPTAGDIAMMLAQLKVEPVATAETGTLEVRDHFSKPGPNIPAGIGSLFWAVKNPLQAWRIFTPVP